MLSIKDIAWAAGFLEGEGSFGVHNQNGTPCVRAGQVQREPLERLQKMFGGSVKFYRRSANNKNRQDFYVWQIFAKRAAEVGMTLFVLLSPRRQKQAEQMLSVWKSRTPRLSAWMLRKAQTHCKHGHEFTPENTKPWARNPVGRQCRECHRIDGRRRYGVKRAALMEASHQSPQ